ncbi:MAG: hypothetical protein OSA84_11400, partial [Akkermansiaceae bacterium]|nr:hypothetical protein [Akkermansiaceae bacterium]
MESKSNIPTSEDKAWLAFKDCSSALETGKLAVELRPRSRDEETAFSGDYDYLMDSSRFEEIVQLFFRVCIENEVSFQILRRAAFKHQIILLGSDERRIIFEFWPHAELTTDTPLKGISFLTYQRFVEACEAGLREETLALLFVCHLFFKRKDPSHSQVQWRLENFSGRMSRVVPQDGLKAPLADKIRELLVSLKLSRLTLAEANHVALGLLSEAEIVLARQGFAKRQRMLAKMGRIFRGWGARIVPCVGPDGSGKTYFITSVLELVQQQSINASTIRFKKLFRRNKIYSHINRRYRK